jgi:hypothetical protein
MTPVAGTTPLMMTARRRTSKRQRAGELNDLRSIWKQQCGKP